MSADSVWLLRVGDTILVTEGSTEYEMTVTWISPPGSAGRSHRAGPSVHASLRPGGWSVDFDAETKHLQWRRAPQGPFEQGDAVEIVYEGGEHLAVVDEQLADGWVSVFLDSDPAHAPSNVRVEQMRRSGGGQR